LPKKIIQKYIDYGQGEKVLPFYFMDWVICTANTVADWLSKILNNVHVGDGDFTQIKKIRHSSALLIGTLDNFTCGNPVDFLKNINKNFQTEEQNKLIFIEKIDHTYQQKHQEVADKILNLIQSWQ